MRLLGLSLAVALAGCGAPNTNTMPDAAVPADLTMGPPPDLGPKPDLSGPCGADVNPRDRPDGSVCVIEILGSVVNEQAALIADANATVCAGICYFGTLPNDGHFRVFINHHIYPDQYALELHGRPDRATYYGRLPAIMDGRGAYANPLLLPLLPKSGPLLALDKTAQSVTSGDVTLTLDVGTDISLDVEDVSLGDPGRQFRALTVADPTTLFFIDPKAPPDALYTFAPFESVFSQKAHLSFANTGKFAPGTAFDVLEQGGLITGMPPAGNFSVVATATVSMDGMRIDTDQGTGVKTLTWIALRKK